MSSGVGLSKHVWRTQSVADRAKSDLEGVGNLRTVDDKIYRWVLNKDASNALTVGQAAYHKLSDAEDMLKYVYQCLTANLSVFAGIVMATDGLAAYVAGTSLSYGWVQVLGINTSISVLGATTGGTDIAVGDYLKGANASGSLVRDAAPPTGPSYNRNVQILEAITTTTTPAAALKKGFIDAL